MEELPDRRARVDLIRRHAQPRDRDGSRDRAPARGGVVYVRSISSVNNTSLGTFDATSDSSNNVALSLTQASWASDGKDANNNAELRIAR